jgi:hypothetical protein
MLLPCVSIHSVRIARTWVISSKTRFVPKTIRINYLEIRTKPLQFCSITSLYIENFDYLLLILAGE